MSLSYSELQKYHRARRVHSYTATEAYRYVQDCRLLCSMGMDYDLDYYVEYDDICDDETGAPLYCVFLCRDVDGREHEVLDCLGGVDSDDYNHPYIVGIAADMMREWLNNELHKTISFKVDAA